MTKSSKQFANKSPTKVLKQWKEEDIQIDNYVNKCTRVDINHYQILKIQLS